LIGLGQVFQATLWIGLDPWVDGLDWVRKNGPMSNSELHIYRDVQSGPKNWHHLLYAL